MVKELGNAVWIVLGIFSAAFGLKGFLLSSKFIDGGVTGISMLVSEVTMVPLALLIPIFNIPFIIIGWRRMGAKFAIKSAIGIAGLALVLAFVHFPDVTPDKLLTSVFGGLFIGAGIGLAIRGGSVLDGTEIAALLVSQKSHLLRVGDIILITNVFIFIAAAFFLSVESAMYSILTYVAASKTIEFLLNGVEQYTAIMVISPHNEEIKQAIMQELNRGVTVLKGHGGMGSTGQKNNENQILYCVITRLEIGSVRSVIHRIDDRAFITTHTLNDVQGGLLKRSVIH